MSGHILVRIIREAYKKNRIKSIISIHFWSIQISKIEKIIIFSFLKILWTDRAVHYRFSKKKISEIGYTGPEI